MEHRRLWVDYAKAIGIILVVYGHVGRGVYNAGIPINKSFFLLSDSIIYSFHMPLFFFLSGMFFCQSLLKRGPIKLLANKIDTVIYPYLLWSVIQGVVEVSLSPYTNGSVTYTDVFMLLYEPRAQFWFLYALFMVFVVASIIYAHLSNHYIFSVFVCSSLIYLIQKDIPSPFHLNFITSNFAFFAFGVWFNRLGSLERLGSRKVFSAVLLAFILFQYVFHELLNLTYADKGIYSFILTVISLLFVVSLSIVFSRKPIAWIAFIGSSSMVIYLTHILVSSGSRIILQNIFDVDSASMHTIIGCLLGIAVPLVAIKYVRVINVTVLFTAPLSQVAYDLYKSFLRR
ncbi:MAG: acyltransferase [Sedimenticola sp.]